MRLDRSAIAHTSKITAMHDRCCDGVMRDGRGVRISLKTSLITHAVRRCFIRSDQLPNSREMASPEDISALTNKIGGVAENIRDMKAAKAPAEEVTAKVAELKALKASFEV